jgi:hypothetical protein
MKKTISKFQRSIFQLMLCAAILSGMINQGNAQSCSADAGSNMSVCVGSTTAPLGGSIGGGTTSATWSDGGAGGTFANNDGSTPGSATYTPASGAPYIVTLTLTATGACESFSVSKTVTVNRLHSMDLVTFYDYSCDRTTFGFSNISQTFTAPFSGYISQVNAGIGYWMTGSSYGTVISTPTHTINYGVLSYSGRCCYAPCVTGNNMAQTNLPTPFYVNAGEQVTISFSGSGGDLHYQDGILRMYIAGHPLVSGTTIAADGATTFCQGNSVNLDGGHFASYNWTPSGNTETINVSATGNYSVVVSDVNGCSASASQSVMVNPLPTVGVNISPASTVSTGTPVTLSGTGASSYSWSGGISDGVPFTATITDTYNVTGTDGNGCVGTASQTITVTEGDNEPPTIMCPFNMTVTAESGQCSATVTYNVTAIDNSSSATTLLDQTSPNGGYITDPKTSSWQSFTTGVSGHLTGVAVEGWWTNTTMGYILNIYNGVGNGGTLLYSQAVTLPNSGPGILDIFNLAPSVNLAGGQQYTWELTNSTPFRLIGYPWASYAGGHGDEWTLQPGWQGMDYHFATYMIPAAVTVVCTPPSGSVFNVGTTTVNAVATDLAGNTATCSFTVTVNPVPFVSNGTSVLANASCTGSTGSATVSVSGGCLPYSYHWSNGQNSQTATNLSAGTYTVTVTDANNSSVTSTATITGASSGLSVSAGADEITYFGYSADQTFSHTAIVTGGTAPFNFTWSMNRPLKCNQITTTGDEIFSSGSCTFNSCPASPLNIVMSSPPSCSGSATVTAMLMDTAQITVTVADANGCSASSSFWVYAEDARCFAGSSGNAKVQICHRNGTTWATICVDQDAVAAHLAHGDYVGRCTTGHRDEASLTEEFASVLTAYPNPFTGTTTIAFSVPSDGPTVVRVFDAMGRKIGVLFDANAKAGVLNKVDFNGENYAPGIYFYSIVSENMNETKRMELVK